MDISVSGLRTFQDALTQHRETINRARGTCLPFR